MARKIKQPPNHGSEGEFPELDPQSRILEGFFSKKKLTPPEQQQLKPVFSALEKKLGAGETLTPEEGRIVDRILTLYSDENFSRVAPGSEGILGHILGNTQARILSSMTEGELKSPKELGLTELEDTAIRRHIWNLMDQPNRLGGEEIKEKLVQWVLKTE